MKKEAKKAVSAEEKKVSAPVTVADVKKTPAKNDTTAPASDVKQTEEKKPKELVIRTCKSNAVVATVDEKTDARIRNAVRPQTKALFTAMKSQFNILMKNCGIECTIEKYWNCRDLVAEADARLAKSTDPKASRKLLYFVKAYDNRAEGCYCFANHGSVKYDNANEFTATVAESEKVSKVAEAK